MEKDCCNMKITEIKDGFRIVVTGKEIKEKCQVMLKKCCSDQECCADEKSEEKKEG